MQAFLIDNDKVYSYEDLLSDIYNSDSYIPMFRTSSLYGYFKNLILALSKNQPLILIDSDITDKELEAMGLSNVNQSTKTETLQLENSEELINKVLYSKSEITIFTSGTTGQPKKVVHSIGTLTRSVRKADKYKGQNWLFAYNPTHMAGLQVFFQAFSNENTLINVFNKNRTFIFNAIEKYSATHISATPTFYRLLLPADREFNSVQRVTLGGEKSSSELYTNIQKLFPNAKLNNIYASTEAGSLFAAKGENFQIPESIKDKFIISEDNELLIHKSLLGKSDSFTYCGEYYNTNDIVEWVDKERGLFRFISRKNELINVGGYKVNPNEVEEIMYQIPEIEQVVVYGKSNSVLGNILCADVCLHKGAELTELQIRQYLTGRLQDFKIPRRVKFVDSFKLTRTGKIKRL